MGVISVVEEERWRRRGRNSSRSLCAKRRLRCELSLEPTCSEQTGFTPAALKLSAHWTVGEREKLAASNPWHKDTQMRAWSDLRSWRGSKWCTSSIKSSLLLAMSCWHDCILSLLFLSERDMRNKVSWTFLSLNLHLNETPVLPFVTSLKGSARAECLYFYQLWWEWSDISFLSWFVAIACDCPQCLPQSDNHAMNILVVIMRAAVMASYD